MTAVDRVKMAMEHYFGEDRRRISHALAVAGYAEELLHHEPGNRELVLVTALLHDIGIREAERKYCSSAGDLQEKEGPPVARKILGELGYDDEAFLAEVCAIIGAHHSPGEVDTDNFRIIWDADWLVNLGEECDVSDRETTRKWIKRIFMTATGGRLAEQKYLNPSTSGASPATE